MCNIVWTDEGLRDPAMVSKSWKAQTISLPAKNACIPIVVTAVYSPVKFWAQLLPTEDTLSSDGTHNTLLLMVT